MKKIITLTAAVMLFTVAFAQYDRDHRNVNDDRGSKDIAYNDNHYKDRDDRRDNLYSFSNRERDMQIAKINREFDRKISSVKHNWFMSHAKKTRLICTLEDQRNGEIKMLFAKYHHGNDHFDDQRSRRH